ncbi:coiled-coil domain-containing protein 153 isoform X3 [Numida meleagris]|uniref:coiled-coil domain-containing protein 153 isoform X3 n=1 Tax=Numida meleagris TaxID=8996 RepID=UPI000B3DAC00|nr:coiled-coil domain-containing protein 153 isoform X3 [Numida meleagris]
MQQKAKLQPQPGEQRWRLTGCKSTQFAGEMWPGRRGLTVKGSNGGCENWSRHWSGHRMTKMTRQYQELQKQTAAHSQHLEAKVKSLQEQLATRLQESQHTQQAATKALTERDRTIAQLQGRMDIMQREYEKILHGSLDLVLNKMAEARQHWEEVSTTICLEHKQRLQEFGLNPLEM